MAIGSFVKGFITGVLAEKNKSVIKDTVIQAVSSPEARELAKNLLIRGGQAVKLLKGLK